MQIYKNIVLKGIKQDRAVLPTIWIVDTNMYRN